MSDLKARAVAMVQNAPDEEMIHVIKMLEWLNSVFIDRYRRNSDTYESSPDDRARALAAWEDFKQYKGIIDHEIDEKAELASARDEKYADFS